MSKCALICGVSGQDGSYLAQLLLSKGYEVIGTSRDAQVSGFTNLKRLGIYELVHLDSMTLTDFRSVLQIVSKYKPDEIYNLSGQSSVGLSFSQPVETFETITIATLNLLEVVRFLDVPIKIYNAGSSECFGETPQDGADEDSAFRPKSPYAVAKAAAYWEVDNYCGAYDIFACTGILFNHESPLRPDRFVTKKIIKSVISINKGEQDRLLLGNLNISRDWGYAPEYVEAMWLMLQNDTPKDYVIASGSSYSLEEFVESAFQYYNLDWHDYVSTDESNMRPSDIKYSRGNPARANKELRWRAKYDMKDVVKLMMQEEQKI